MRTLEPLFTPPERGTRVAWINDSSQGVPPDWRVAKLSATPLYALIEAHVPGGSPGDIYSFWVPLACLLAVKDIKEPKRLTDAAPVSRAADPEGLTSCKTYPEFMALAEKLGMNDDNQIDLLTLLKRAPNNGQLVMRGRNTIRNWIRKKT